MKVNVNISENFCIKDQDKTLEIVKITNEYDKLSDENKRQILRALILWTNKELIKVIP